MKERKYNLGKKRMDKLCKRFGLNLEFQHSRSGSHEVGYYCVGQDISVDIEFSRKTILC